MSTRARNLALAVIPLLFGAAHASAWSDLGHEVVCQIAFLELSPANQKKVQDLLAAEPDARFNTFPTACTFADDKKHTKGTIQNQRRDDHFINVARNLTKITSEDCGAATQCLFKAIHQDMDDLKPTSGKDRLQALKFLGHWMGDIHQPLHVSYADDSGGNAISTQKGFDCPDMHNVWDACIPEDALQHLGATDDLDMAAKLQAAITAADRTKWRNSTPVDWAEESYALARTADVHYCTLNQAKTSCCYSKTECVHQHKHRTFKVTQAYEDSHEKIVRQRLQQAGVRLAKVLEDSLQ